MALPPGCTGVRAGSGGRGVSWGQYKRLLEGRSGLLCVCCPVTSRGPYLRTYSGLPLVRWRHLLTIDTSLALDSERDLRSLGFRLQCLSKCNSLTLDVPGQEGPLQPQSAVSVSPQIRSPTFSALECAVRPGIFFSAGLLWQDRVG